MAERRRSATSMSPAQEPRFTLRSGYGAGLEARAFRPRVGGLPFGANFYIDRYRKCETPRQQLFISLGIFIFEGAAGGALSGSARPSGWSRSGGSIPRGWRRSRPGPPCPAEWRTDRT